MAARGTAGEIAVAIDPPLECLSRRLDAILEKPSVAAALRRAASPARALPPPFTMPIRAAAPFASPTAEPRPLLLATSASRLANEAACQTLSISDTGVQTETAVPVVVAAAVAVPVVPLARTLELSSNSLSPTAASSSSSPLNDAVRVLDARLAASERHDALSHAFATWCDVFSRRPLATQSPIFAFALLRWLRRSWGASEVDAESPTLLRIGDEDQEYDARVATNEAASGAAYGFTLPLQRPSLLASALDVSRLALLRWTMRAWSSRARRMREFAAARTRGCALRAISALRLRVANANARALRRAVLPPPLFIFT